MLSTPSLFPNINNSLRSWDNKGIKKNICIASYLGMKPKDMSDIVKKKEENNSSHVVPLVPFGSVLSPSSQCDGYIKTHRWTDRGWKWPSALNTDTELQSIRLSHFDSPSSLNCSVNLAAALSRLTYWSPESVLRVLCPTNRLLCPPWSPHSLSTYSDRPAMMMRAPSPLSPVTPITLILSIYYHMEIQQSATDERKLYLHSSKIMQLFSVNLFCKQTLKLWLHFNSHRRFLAFILHSSVSVNTTVNVQGYKIIWFIKTAVCKRNIFSINFHSEKIQSREGFGTSFWMQILWDWYPDCGESQHVSETS